jgi:DNA-binding NarL/FixJ family response regulator
MERIEKACDGEGNATLVEEVGQIPNSSQTKSDSGSDVIVLLDLSNIKKSPVETIQAVNERSPEAKTLAVHIYTTKLLIEPLIDAGANGYLTYEPTVAELRKALSSVCRDEMYLPSQIYG